MEYTIHRVLSMIKTTEARIEKELADTKSSWVRVAKGQEDNISGVSIKNVERDIQSHYDRVVALIDNYIKLKSALIRSNAGVRSNTEVSTTKVCGKSFTISEIIELQNKVYGRTKKVGFKARLLEKMRSDYVVAQRNFDAMQIKADDEVGQYISAMVGRRRDDDETDTSTKSVIEATSKMLHEQKDPCFIDPLKIAEKIVALENELERFNVEADSVLSEQNALTKIEIDLNEIK
jgi:hypothetical protein